MFSAKSRRASITSTSTAPAARARSWIASSSPGFNWPTSTAHATTSTSQCSRIHRTAIDVSSPPEYARTTRCFMIDTHSFLETCEGGEVGGNRSAADRILDDEEERVVAGDGTEDVMQPGPVECGTDDMGTPGRRAQHDDV